jgi:signal transduction histidine kinase
MIIIPKGSPSANEFLQYASNASHDLLNHMTVLYGCSQLVAASLGDDAPSEFAHMQATMRDITDYICTTSEYRYSFTPTMQDLEPLGLLWNLPDYVDELFDTLHKDVTGSFSFDLPDSLPHITGDSMRIRNALVGIIRNSVEAMPDDGEILISAVTDEQYLKISITDHGTGIDPDLMKSLGHPFTTSKPGHAGMGLATAANTAHRHGGHVEISSTAHGTRTTLALPLS